MLADEGYRNQDEQNFIENDDNYYDDDGDNFVDDKISYDEGSDEGKFNSRWIPFHCVFVSRCLQSR